MDPASSTTGSNPVVGPPDHGLVHPASTPVFFGSSAFENVDVESRHGIACTTGLGAFRRRLR